MAGISLYGFLDETGDLRRDARIYMCCYVSSDEYWEKFSTCWGHELRMVGLEDKSIHATELLSQSGDFFGWKKEDADNLVDRLVDVIRSTVPIGLAVGFDAARYRTFTQGQQNNLGRPLIVCMSRAIDLAIEVVTEMRNRGDDVAGINMIFDDSEKDAVDMLRAWIQLKKARKEVSAYVRSVGFADDKAFYPLQAADLLANLMNRYWRPSLGGRPNTSDRAELQFRQLCTPDEKFPFAFREKQVEATEMNDAVRKQNRLY